MRYRLTLVPLLISLIALASCGEPARKPRQGNGKPSGEQGGPRVGRFRGMEWRWGVKLCFDRRGEHGQLREPGPEYVLARASRVIEKRLESLDIGKFEMWISPGDELSIFFARALLDKRDDVVALLTRPDTIEFRIEVRPDEDSHPRRSPRTAPGGRRLWPGTRAEFDAFKGHEIEVWKAAAALGTPYRPSHSAYELVPEADAADRGPEAFHIVEVPARHERFGGHLIEDPVVTEDENGRPVVVFSVRSSWQERFGDWTERNRNLAVAIVRDGIHVAAPVIVGRMERTIQITPGTGEPDERRREATDLVAALEAGSLPVVARLISAFEP